MKEKKPIRTEISSWLEWKLLCALELCSGQTKTQLSGFGLAVLTNLFRKADPDLRLAPGLESTSAGSDSNREKWQVFETYMHASSQKTGKRWKDWLFERAASSPDETAMVLEKEVCCCMRTAVRDFCTKEGRTKERFQKHFLVSKDAPLNPGEPDSLNLEDLEEKLRYRLTPSVEVEFLELRELSHKVALNRFDSMSFEARVAVLASVFGVSLAKPEVESATKCGKSKLYKLLTELEKEILRELERYFDKDDSETTDAAAQLTIQKIGDLCWEKLRSEKACSSLFLVMET